MGNRVKLDKTWLKVRLVQTGYTNTARSQQRRGQPSLNLAKALFKGLSRGVPSFSWNGQLWVLAMRETQHLGTTSTCHVQHAQKTKHLRTSPNLRLELPCAFSVTVSKLRHKTAVR